jgi:hypothetical protein
LAFRISRNEGVTSSCAVFRPLAGPKTLTVPNHDEIDRGTLHAIYRQASRYIPEPELRRKFFTD